MESQTQLSSSLHWNNSALQTSLLLANAKKK